MNQLAASAKAEPVDELNPFWSHVVGAGRANEGLRADWQKHLKMAQLAGGFCYVRFHGLFHDDMHVVAEVDGKHVYNFQYIDALFDAMLELDARPFVEFGFCPSLMATQTATVFWWKANGSPPKVLSEWSDLITATVQHWVHRYGLREVRTWFFECWNEPNLRPFFTGTRSEYYALYEATVTAVKAVDHDLPVGGPATSNFVPDTRFDGEVEDYDVQRTLADVANIDALKWQPVWITDFLDWCFKKGLPVDFVSTHPYPTDWALDGSGNLSKRVRELQATPNDLKQLREIVSKSPFPDAQIHLTEWSSSPSPRDCMHDEVPMATYIIRTMLASLNTVDTLAYWTFTDVFEEDGPGPEPFHGGFGLINLQGIPKPSWHAFRLLHKLGDEVLARHDDHGIVTRCSTTRLLSALIFHYPPEVKTSPPPAYMDRDAALATVRTGSLARKQLLLTDITPGTLFRLEKLVPGAKGDPMSLWRAWGCPSTLSRDLTKELRSSAETLTTRYIPTPESGQILIDEVMIPWSVTVLNQVVT